MRKLFLTIACSLVAFLLFAVDTGHAADKQVRLYLNRTEMKSDVPARIVNGNTLVPVRIISEGIGAEVNWSPNEQKVTVEKNGLNIQLTINKTAATVNGVRHDLEVAPVLDSGTTLLPVRFVTENLGLGVQWDQLTASVFLFDSANSLPVSGSDGSKPSVPAGATPTPKPSAKPTPNPSATPSPGQTKTPQTPASPTPGTNGTVKPGNGSAGGSGKLPEISGITISDNTLKVQADNGVLKPSISRLANPDRLVIDIPNAALASAVNSKAAVQNGEIAVNHDTAVKIRYSLYQDNPSTVRIVVDLKQKIEYTLLESKNPGELAVFLGPSSAIPPGANPAGNTGGNPGGSPNGNPQDHSPGKEGKYVVVLDAGHGDHDPGASSKSSGRKEKDFNLAMILKVAQALKSDPLLNVRLTRQDDTFVELDDRVSFANGLQADVFVSVHANSYNNESVTGTETYYSRDESKALADVLHKHITAATTFSNRSVRKNDLRVTKNTVMPAVLCEIGYISNPQDEAAMFDEAFQTRVAESIAAGIREYLQIP